MSEGSVSTSLLVIGPVKPHRDKMHLPISSWVVLGFFSMTFSNNLKYNRTSFGFGFEVACLHKVLLRRHCKLHPRSALGGHHLGH